MDYNRCPECGMPLEPNAKKCTFCGKKLRTKKESPATFKTYGNTNTSNPHKYAGPPYEKQNAQGSAGNTSDSNRYSSNPSQNTSHMGSSGPARQAGSQYNPYDSFPGRGAAGSNASKSNKWVLTVILGICVVVVLIGATVMAFQNAANRFYHQEYTLTEPPQNNYPSSEFSSNDGIDQVMEAIFDKPSAAVTEEEIGAIRYLKISDNYDDGSIDIFFSDRDYYDYGGSDEYFDDYVNYTYVEDTYLEAEDLARFKGLTRLVLDGAYLEDVSSYKALQNLRGLFLYNTVYGYSDLDVFQDFPQLEGIGIDYITDLSGLDQFTNLKELNLYNSSFTNLDDILPLTSLERLSIEENYVINSLEGVQNLPNLKYLDLFYNEALKDLSPISQCEGLTELSVDLDYAEEIPDLTTLTNLESLELGYFMDLSALNINNLPQLKEISFYSGSFDDHNFVNICSMSQLERLNMNWCTLYCDTDSLANLVNLTHLGISENGISNIDFVEGMGQLEYLDISLNKVQDVSKLAGLSNLTYLDVSGNPVTDTSVLDQLKMEGVEVYNYDE
ncbi:leucine-rich repeat domain-containing protein [Diplocloster hominis]|uniref:leucine-rich repeat domain-containing protein n=1 Tax=Diplocloster hominis TaxID=3079010 RepID=UPI0031BA8819